MIALQGYDNTVAEQNSKARPSSRASKESQTHNMYVEMFPKASLLSLTHKHGLFKSSTYNHERPFCDRNVAMAAFHHHIN